MYQRGLTLLEMMVVLLIAGMAITLGYQSLGQWQRANNAISSINGMHQQSMLTKYWLTSSLNSFIPIAEHPFKGDNSSLTGIATQPIQSHQGGAITVTWAAQRIQNEWQLVVSEDDTPPLHLPLPDAQQVSFTYLDKDNKPYNQWPPKLGQHENLPAAILLNITLSDGSQRIWGAAITGARSPFFNPFEDDLD